MFIPYSWITYDGNGTTATFGIPFPYVAREHVHVYIGWDPSTRSFTSELEHGVGFTFASGNQITTTVPPGASQDLTILRITPITQPLSDWQAGSPPTARELDVADRQVLYAVQEYIDQTLQAREDLDAAVLTGSTTVLVDNLNSTLATAALTANQGRALRLLIEAVQAATATAQAAATAAGAAATAAQAGANAAGTAAANAATAAANAQATASGALPLAGGTMTGKATLDGSPTAPLHAAPRQYVDEHPGLLDAFVNFTVAGMVINSSRNVSSVVYLSVGSYRINFTAPFPNNGYAWAGAARGNGANNLWLGQPVAAANKTASSIVVASYQSSTAVAEASEISFAAYL